MKQGKDTIILVQRTNAVLGDEGLLIGSQTDATHSKENEVLDEQTKFGRIVGYGNTSESLEFTAYGEENDAGQNAVVDAIDNKEQIKAWKVNVKLNANGLHDAVFAYCIVENVEESSPQDGFVEVSGTLQVIGTSQKGEIPALPPEMIEFAQYGFEEPGATTGEFPNQTAAPEGP